MISKLTNDIVSTIAEDKPLIYISEEAIYLKRDNDRLKEENKRLNNIINELEEYIVIKLKEFNTPEEYYTLKQIDDIHYRLQELKGSDK